MSHPVCESLFGNPRSVSVSQSVRKPASRRVIAENFHSQSLFAVEKKQQQQQPVKQVQQRALVSQSDELDFEVTAPFQPKVAPQASRHITENLFGAAVASPSPRQQQQQQQQTQSVRFVNNNAYSESLFDEKSLRRPQFVSVDEHHEEEGHEDVEEEHEHEEEGHEEEHDE